MKATANITSLLLIAAAALSAGCAAVAQDALPSFGKGWRAMYEQAQGAAAYEVASKAPPAPQSDSRAWDRAIEGDEEAAQALKSAREVAGSINADQSRMRQALSDLEYAEGIVARRAHADPLQQETLRQAIAEIRRRIEARLIEVLRIEPTFELKKPGRTRIAVVRIGEGVETIRAAEREEWKRFLSGNGFELEPVFIPACLVAAVDSGSVRAAAARMGADAVIAYTTSSTTSAGPLSGSAAVLSFAKCMLLDTRTEYLYLNAEGECRRKRVGLPGCVSARGLTLECAAGAVRGMLGEIRRELGRLAQD